MDSAEEAAVALMANKYFESTEEMYEAINAVDCLVECYRSLPKDAQSAVCVIAEKYRLAERLRGL